MISASGADARSSVLTCKGRIDLAVIFADKVFLIEFKCNQRPDIALEQIRTKHYADPYRVSGKVIVLLGIEFSAAQRNIADWNIEKLKPT